MSTFASERKPMLSVGTQFTESEDPEPAVLSAKPAVNPKEKEFLEMWTKDRDELMRKKNIEIVRLKKKNEGLVENVKRMSEEVNTRISRLNLGKKLTEQSQSSEQKIVCEIECLESMKSMYGKEVKQLKDKLKKRAGFMTVIDAEKKLVESGNKQTELLVQKRNLEKTIKGLEKAFEKADFAKEAGTMLIEEQKGLKMLNKEFERAERLEKRLKQEGEVTAAKDKMIQEYLQKIKLIEKENEKLKADALQVAQSSDAPAPPDIAEDNAELAKEQYDNLKQELDKEVKSNKKQISELETQLTTLQSKHKELTQRNQIQYHNMLECERILKIDRMRELGRAAGPVKKSAIQLKHEEILARMTKMREYPKLIMKNKKPRSLRCGRSVVKEMLNFKTLSSGIDTPTIANSKSNATLETNSLDTLNIISTKSFNPSSIAPIPNQQQQQQR